MSNKKCCVPGCVNSLETNVNLHKFPNPYKDKDLFNTWVYSIGGDILELEDNHIFKYRRVCHVHFKIKYWCRNNRITKNAVPTKNMTGLSSLKFNTQTRALKSLQSSKASTSKEKNTRTNVPHSTAPLSRLLSETQQKRCEPEKEVFDCNKDDNVIQPDPSEKVPEGPFTWQREAITCADDEDLRLRYEPDDQQLMAVDLETAVESEKDGGYLCDECGCDILGVRYVCVQCADYDVCAPCEARGAHALHYALRVPIDKHTDEVLRVVEAVRKCINDDPSLILLPTSDTVKIEVKDEEEQVTETEYEADPLMVPPAQSAESCRRVPDLSDLTPDLASGEHTQHTQPTAPLSTDIHTYNQPFIFNASSTQDTGRKNSEMYILKNIDQKEGGLEDMSTENKMLTQQLIEVDDQSYSMASDDINDLFANVDRSNGEYTIRSPSSVARETKPNVKLKLVNTTKHLVKEITDLNFMQSNNLLIVIDRLDKSQLDKTK